HVLPDQTVIVKDGKITAIGAAKKVKIPSGAERINAKGKYLMPGLGDMHTHIYPFGQDTVEAVLMLLASYGVTTIRNVDYFPQSKGGYYDTSDSIDLVGPKVLKYRRLANDGEIVSPRIYTSGPWYRLMVIGDPPKMVMAILPAGGKGVYDLMKSYKEKGYDFLKIHDEPRDIIDSVLDAAKKLNIQFMGHVPEYMPIEKALTAGYKCIEHLTGYNDKIMSTDGELKTTDTLGLPIKMAKATVASKQKVWNCPTLTMNQPTRPSKKILEYPENQYLTDSTMARWTRWLNTPESEEQSFYKDSARMTRIRYRMVKALHDAGAGLVSGTDAPCLQQVPGPSLHHELSALVRAGLTPYEALKTSTYNIADYFGTLKEIGTVTVGKRADLVLIDANPLNDISNTRKISGVVLNGRWISKQQFDQMLSKHKRKIPM
ncbi:MAG: amidohydrolase family protein, partial [Chitinophagaceae bacterium]|nr:amidohydrolase family protein [Chitinophagaceae bacterium]